ncbi:MAG: hypothetical protein V1696_01495 [Candidatus Jorgensenbacteria bacterium]
MAPKSKPKQKPEPLPAPQTREVTWRAAEYEHVEKTTLWYIGVAAAALIIALIGLWQRNFFFVVFIAVAAAVIIAFGRKRPQVVEFRVGGEGVAVGKQFLPYERLQNFSLRERPGRLDELVLMKKTMVAPFLKISMDGKVGTQVHDILKEKLPEVEHQESLVDLIAEWLGF